jgi:hypothetical protein
MGLDYRFLGFWFAVFSLTSCSSFMTKSKADIEQIWVYVELESANKKDTSIYYFYGKINQSIFDEIERNPKASGLFVLSDVRYTNKDDLLTIYDDKETFGVLAFRIEDIQHIMLYKDDPVYLFEIEELDESALRLRKLNNNSVSK